jgi:carbonic anhydrase
MACDRVSCSLLGIMCLSVLQPGCGDAPPASNTTPGSNVSDGASPIAANSDETPSPTVAENCAEPIHHYLHQEEQPHAAEWGYTGEIGPSHWGDLSPEYVLAKTGRRQSPIDIAAVEPSSMSAIEFAYGPSLIDLVYNGHTVEEVEDHHSSITVDGKRYALQQFHFHSPSEHTVNGKHSDMEMHLVHKSDDGTIAVIGVLIEQGADNPAFDQVWNYLPTETNRERKESVTIDAATLLPTDSNYYRYTGSFTTPPCTEDVLWMILTTPVELSEQQVTKFRKIIDGNNRPVQPINDRTVAGPAIR